MSRFSIAVVVMGLGASLSIVETGCAGELTDAQKEMRDGAVGGNTGGSGGSGGSGGGSGSGGTTGGSGGGGSPEACVMALTKIDSKACSIAGCHGGTQPAAGLLLTDDAIRQPKDQLVDKPNKGAVPGCQAGMAKLIDRAQPEKSLLYTKLSAQSPCGKRMPEGNPLNDAEMACVLNWIKSVASAP